MMVHKQTLEDRVKKARGDNDLTGTLITEFKPFIASVAQKRVGRYLKYGTDEELSVSLLAFKEAIDSFNPGKGRFLSFARMVISMRLIDYYRKQNREASMSPGDDEDTDLAWDRKSVEKYRVEEEKEDLKAEVIGYSTSLSRWGISLDELANVSPRRQELRELYQGIARMIAGNKDMLDSLMKTGHLPIKEIEKEASIHRKKLERGRIYIIAMVLAVMADFSYLDMCRSEG